MAQRIIVEYTYIFYCDGKFFEHNVFGSDEDAIKHAKDEAEEAAQPLLALDAAKPALKTNFTKQDVLDAIEVIFNTPRK